jgi:hypothetical protein
MMLSLRKDEAGWEPLGAVEKEKLAITEKQKSEYQEKLGHYSSRATEKRLDVLHELEDRKVHWFLAWLSGVSHS